MDWWLRRFLQFVVGGGGLVWELVIDRLHNPLALVILGAIATGTDLVRYGSELIRRGRAEFRALEHELDEEDELEERHSS